MQSIDWVLFRFGDVIVLLFILYFRFVRIGFGGVYFVKGRSET